jgi:hypothetical protein
MDMEKRRTRSNRKELPKWFNYSVKSFTVAKADDIDDELIKLGKDGADVINIILSRGTPVYGEWVVFYRHERP